MPVPAHQVKWEGGMLCGTSTLVTSGNFSSVLDSLKRAEFEYSTLDYETDTVQESKDWCVRSGVKVDVMGSEIVGAGVRVGNNNYYFCVDHADTDNVTLDQLEEVLRFISKKRVYVHNSIFEQTVTYNAFGWMLPDVYDTAIEASYVSENDSAGLKFLSGHWLDYKQTSYAETVGDKSGMRELTGEETLGYGASDVYVTDALQNLFETIMTYEKSWDAFVQVEVDSLYFVAQCFINGMDFDPEWHEKLVKENIEKKEESWATIQDYLFEIGWEGSEFKPLKGFNIATLKKVYLTKYGEPLKATSVKGACKELEDREIVSAFEEKDIDAVNKIYKQFWKPKAELNLRSPKQMKYLFYEALGLPVRIRNKPTEAMIKKGITQGSEATDEHAIKHALKFDEALGHNEFLKALVDYKGCLTKESLFFEKLPNFVHWKTGKIHASLRQCSTTTRRDSCSAPNNQQLSKKKDVRIRNMYKAKEGYTLVALDFSGQELRIAADDCQDENMLSCYIGDDLKDIHSLTGLRIANELGHGWTYEEFVNLIREEDFYEGGKKKVATPFRILAKFTNFGSNYGSLAPKLAQMMVITTEEAQKYLEARAETFPGLIKRAEDYKAECKKKKYSLTYLGGRRHLDGRVHFSSRDKFTLLAAERLAYSFRIQSSGSEILKIARGKVAKSEMVEKGHVLPATCIHDEQVVQVRTDMLDEIIPQLVDIMEAPYADMKVPMITEPEFGSHLGSLKPWVK
jgi:DNA polymerase I-like protein with 3'-5' exonuclease and polymerase domains